MKATEYTDKYKIIACDVDGTLLPNGETVLNPELFELIKELSAAGILFCVASGRSLGAVKALFGPVKDIIAVISDNGANVFLPGENGKSAHIAGFETAEARELAKGIFNELGCSVYIATALGDCFLWNGSDDLGYLKNCIAGELRMINSPEEIGGEVFKMTGFFAGGVPDVESRLKSFVPEKAQVVKAGKNWLDFSPCGKGQGMELLCGMTGVPFENVLALGDAENDISMLDRAGTALLVETGNVYMSRRYENRCLNAGRVFRNILEGKPLLQDTGL